MLDYKWSVAVAGSGVGRIDKQSRNVLPNERCTFFCRIVPSRRPTEQDGGGRVWEGRSNLPKGIADEKKSQNGETKPL